MKTLVAPLLCLALSACGSKGGAVTPIAPTNVGWTLTWSDEFEGPSGSAVDAAKWTFDVGGGGWGNQELESYTDRPRNAHLSGDGSLVIDVLRESATTGRGAERNAIALGSVRTASRLP